MKIIRGSKDSETAHNELVSRFELSNIQAKAILDMRLARLTGLERDKIVNEYNAIMEVIADLKNILETPARVIQMIKDELVDLRREL